MKIPFNKPYLSGHELNYIQQAVTLGKISGDGYFTRKCHDFFEKEQGFQKVLLTTSCTHALEMAAILIDIKPGDEVIMPSYTFVSTANAFVLRGASVVFADSKSSNPNLDVDEVSSLITSRTRAIVPVHYAGIACDMDPIMALAEKHGLWVIEDAAQAVDSFYKGRRLGSIGHLGAFSFHETKNIISGEGGMLAINDPEFNERAEIIREKGTNRSLFFRGAIDKYGWVDIGSSYLPSEIIAAYLFAQLESIDRIQQRRKKLWGIYHDAFKDLPVQNIQLPFVDDFATNNGHMYYLVCKDLQQRTAIIDHLKQRDVWAVFHYQSLHKSEFFHSQDNGRQLPNSDRYTDHLVRLPLFYELSDENCKLIATLVVNFFSS